MAIVMFENTSWRNPMDMPEDLGKLSTTGTRWMPRTIRIVFDDEKEMELFRAWWHRAWVKEGKALGNLPCFYYTGKSHTQSPVDRMNLGVLEKWNEFYRNAKEFTQEFYKQENSITPVPKRKRQYKNVDLEE